MAAEERWYFSRDQLENTPSKKCGIDPEKELSYRQQAANFIQDMGQRLQVSQLCINTSIVYMHRFYMFHSFQKFHRNAISTCALFLAAKVEEQSRKLEHVIKVAHMCLHRDAPTLDTKSEAYLEQCQELVINENIMLQTLGFDVAIDHPHTHVVKCCQLVRGGWQSSHQHHASKELAQTSYVMATNSLHLTTMCLQYKPTVVACVCIHLACKWSNWEIPKSSEGKRWFWYVDKSVTEELLEELTAEFLAILDRCPNRMKRKMLSYSGMERMPDPGNYDRRSNADMDGSNRGSPNASGSSSSGASTSRGDRGDHYSGPMPALVRDNLFGGKAGAPSSSHARPTNAVDRNGGPAPSSSCADRKPQTHKGPVQNHPSRPHASANSSASTSAGPAAKHAAATVAANALSSPTLTDFPASSQNSADNFPQQQPPPPVTPASGNSAVKKLKPSSKEYRAGAATTSADSEKPLKQQQQQQHHQPPKPHGHHQGNHVGRAQRPPPAAKPHILTPSPPTPRDEEPFPAPSMDLSSPPPRPAEAPSMATPPTPLLPVACEVPAAAKADNHRKREREESAGRPPPAADPLRRHEARDAKERQTRPHKSKTPPAIPPTPEPQKPAAVAQAPQPPQQPPVAVRPDARRAEQDISNISRTIAPASHHVPQQQPPPPPATATVNPAARNSSSSLNEPPPQPPHSRLQPQAPDASKAAAAPPPPESPAAVPRTPHQSSKKEKRHKSKSRDRDKERSHERREPAPPPSLVTTPIKLTIPKDRITAAVPAAGGPKRTLEPPSPGSLKLKISKEKLNSTPPVAPAVPVAAALPPQPPPPPAEPVAASLKIKITKDRSGAMGAYNLSVPAAATHDSRKRERPEDAEEPRQPQKTAKQSARAGRRGSGGDHGDVPPSSNTRSAGGYPPQGMMPHPQPPPHMQQQPRGRKGGGKPGMGMHPPYRHPQPGGYPPGYGPQFYQYPPGPPPPAMPGYFMHPGHQGHPGGEYQHPGDYDYHRHQQPYFNQFQPPPMRPGMGFQHPPPHPHPHLMQQQQPPRPMHPLPPREPPLPREPPPAIPPPPPPE